MASGLKQGMPEVIFVISLGYEVRYYTTADTFAQGLIDWSNDNPEIEVFFPSSGLAVDAVVQGLAKLKALQTPDWLFNAPRDDGTPAQKAARRAWNKRKRQFKEGLLAMIKDAVGPTP